jgi:aminoglycoside phosphotransferase (APT) family kinase protein
MGGRQQQFSGSGEVRHGHELDLQRLQRYLEGHVGNFSGPLAVKQFRGGQSNPTYLLQSPSGNYVMRRKPPGQLLQSAHAVDREFRVLSALHAVGFPVPKPLLLCTDETVAGTMFYLMEFVQGRVCWDLDLLGLAPRSGPLRPQPGHRRPAQPRL